MSEPLKYTLSEIKDRATKEKWPDEDLKATIQTLRDEKRFIYTPKDVIDFAKVEKWPTEDVINTFEDLQKTKRLAEYNTNDIKKAVMSYDQNIRFNAAKQKQLKDALIWTTPQSVPYDTSSTLSQAASKGKNVVKGLFDILNIPKRLLGSLEPKQKFKDPNAYLGRELIQKLPEKVLKSPYSEGSIPLRSILDVVGSIAADPLTYVSGGLAPLGKRLLKGALNIKPETAKRFMDVLQEVKGIEPTALPARTGRKEIVDFMAKENLHSTAPGGFEKVAKLTDKKIAEAKRIMDEAAGVSTPLERASVNALQAATGRRWGSLQNEIFDINDTFDKLISGLQSGEHVAPDKITRMTRELRQLQREYTAVVRSGEDASGNMIIARIPGRPNQRFTTERAEIMRRMLEQDPTEAKDLAARAIFKDLQDILEPGERQDYIKAVTDLKKLNIVKDVVENAAEARDTKDLLGVLASQGLIGGTKRLVDLATQVGSGRSPSLLLQLDYLNKLGMTNKIDEGMAMLGKFGQSVLPSGSELANAGKLGKTLDVLSKTARVPFYLATKAGMYPYLNAAVRRPSDSTFPETNPKKATLEKTRAIYKAITNKENK